MWVVQIIFGLQKVGVAAVFATVEKFLFSDFQHFLTSLNALWWTYKKGKTFIKKNTWPRHYLIGSTVSKIASYFLEELFMSFFDFK